MKDDDMFSFENDDFNMPSFDNSGGGKKKSFFKDLAKGVVVGSYNKLEKYIPALQDTKESAADMSDQIRDQASMVKQQVNRAGSYFKGVTDDVKKISDEIKNTKGLRAKISAAEKGFDQAKKNLAYAIDPEAAASFDMDAMFDDGDYSSSNSTTVSPGKSTSQPDSTTETKLRNEKLGIDSDFGLPPSSKSERTSSSGRKFFNQTIVNGDSSDKIMADRLSAEALRETVMASSAAIISSQSKIFKQTNIINTKMHLEKMNALNRIAESTYMSSKLYAEQIAPTQLQINDRLAKNEAQLSDVIALLRDANGGDSPIAKALGGNKRGGKRNIMDFVTSSGGIDLGGLYRHTSTQLKEQADGMGLGMVSSLKDMLPMMLMGGDKTSAGKSLGKLIGGLALSPFKGKITAIGDTLSQALPNTLLNTYDKMKHSDNSMLSGLAELMNIDTGTKGTVDLDTRNRRVSFDMVTRRSIVEVIPGYLSKILSAVNGKEEMSFDHKTGQFTTKSIMQNRIQKQIDNAGMGSFDSTKRNLSKRDSTLKDSDMNKILKNIMMSGRPFNVENLGDNNYYRKISEGVSKEAFAQFLDAYDGMDSKEKAQLSISATRARKSRTDTLNSLSVDLSEYGEGSFLGSSQIDAKIKDLERQKFDVEKIKGNGSVDMRGKAIMMDKLRKNAGIDMEIADLKTIQAASGDVKGDVSSAISNSPINKIYDLLLDGILVYPQNVDGLPAHIRKARKSRKNEAFEKDAAKRNLDRANSEYERILRELSGQQGEELENALENRKLNVAQQLLKSFGGEVGIKKIFGDTNGDKILSKIQKVSNSSPWNEYSNAGNKILGKVEKFVNDVQTPDGSIDFSKMASKSGTAVAEVKATFENLKDQYKDPEVAKKKLFDIYNESKAKVSEAYTTSKEKASEEFSKAKDKILESYSSAKEKASEAKTKVSKAKDKTNEAFSKTKTSDIYNESKAKVSEAYATSKEKANDESKAKTKASEAKSKVSKEFSKAKVSDVFKTSKEKASEEFSKAKDKVSKASDIYNESKAKVSEAYTTSKEKAKVSKTKVSKDKAKDKILEAYSSDKTKEKISKAKEKASEAKSKTKASDIYNESKAKTKVSKDKAKDKVLEAYSSAKEKANEAFSKTKAKASDIYNESKAKVSEAYTTGKEKAKEKASEAKSKVSKEFSKAKEKASETKSKTKASDIYNETKAKASEAFSKAKEKASEEFSKADEIINGKIGDLKNKIKTPEQLKTKLAEESMDDETKKKVKDASDSSIVGMLGAFVTGTMAKFNTALFGKDESKIPHKTGFLGTAFDKVRSLPGMVMKFLVGDKKMGKVGLLQTMGAPFLKMMENARHSLMSKFIIPFKSISEQMKESIKWKARDRAIWLKNLGVKLRGSKEVRNAKKAERRKRRNEKLLAKGKIPGNSVWDKVFGLGTNLSNVAVSPFALATRFSLNRSDKKMQKLLASGKISQEDYDEWISKQEEAQDSELARHNRNEEDIKSLQNKVDTSRINDAKLRAEIEGMNGTTDAQKAKIDKMSYADIKADQKRAKAAMKANKEKLARGEKLTREEEYAALTQQQLLYRMQDDNKKKLENEVKRQEEAAEREKMEMQREQTNATKDSKDFLAGILWYMSGGKSGKKPIGAAAQAKKDAKDASGRYDTESGLLNGSYADQKADAMENAETKLLKEISEKIPKDNPKIKAEEKEDKKSLLDRLKDIAGLIAGGIGIAGVGRSAFNVYKRFKEDGFVGGIGELTGIDRYGDSAFDANGNKKGFLQASADRFRGGRYILRKIGKRIAKNAAKKAGKNAVKKGFMKTVAKKIGKQLGTKIPGVSKSAGIVAKKIGKLANKIPGVGKAAGTVAKGAKTVGTKITGMLQRFFNIPAIAKKVPKSKVAGIIGKITARVGQSAVGKAAGSVLKFLSGPAGIAAMAAADFATGAAQAKRYFKIGPGQKATAGMRTAAGLSNALNNGLLMGIIPMDWLTETIYRIVADDKAEAALDAQQQAYRERAEMLGVDPERLNELENKTLGKKFLNMFKGKDKKLAEEAKLMGMSVEEYAEWKKTYDESLKVQDTKTEKAKEIAESKIVSQSSINSNGGLLIPNANGGKFNANGETTNSSGEVVNKEAIEAAAELAQNPEALEGMDNESKKKLSELLKIGIKNGIKAASVGQLALRQNIKKGINKVKEGIKNTPARIAESMKNFYGLSKNAAKAIATGLTNAGKGIANAGKTVFNKVSGGLSAAGTMFVTGAKNVGNKISETVKAFKADPKGFVADLGDKIKNSFDSIKDKVSEGLLKAWEGFKDVITAFGEKLKSGFINVVDGVKEGWAKLTGGVKNAAGKVKDSLDAFWNPDMTDAENIAMAEKMGLDANSMALEQQIKNPDYKLASGNYDTTSIQSDLGKNGEKIESSMRSVEDVAASNDMYLNKLDEIATMANNAKAMEQSHNDMMTQTGTMNKELQVVESQTVIFQQMLAVLRSMQMSGQTPVVNYNGKPVELRYQEGQNVPVAVPVNYNGNVSQLPSYDPTIYADVGT